MRVFPIGRFYEVRVSIPARMLKQCFTCERMNGGRCKNHAKKMSFLRGKLAEVESGIYKFQNIKSVVERILEKDPDKM